MRQFLYTMSFILLAGLYGCGNNAPERETLFDEPRVPEYRLAILQFTERGNLLQRDHFLDLQSELRGMAKSLVVIFVHGWKHNAEEGDENLESFRHMLADLRRARVVSDSREIVGVYIGWPGASMQFPAVEEASFWARKAVAEEVGKGGVSEMLLQIEHIQSDPQMNRMMVTIGHSFGGAIVTSALSEVMLSRVIGAERSDGCRAEGEDACQEKCVKAKPFGDVVVVLNPALEANEVLPLRSAVAERCFPPLQPKLMHVISTSADTATHTYFPIGQGLDMLFWEEDDALEHEFRGQQMVLDEHELDTTTMGNYPPFWTGILQSEGDSYSYCSLADKNFKSCANKGTVSEMEKYQGIRAIPSRSFEPLSFIYTEKGFMDDHNDIFNPAVAAYLATLVRESRTVRFEPVTHKYSIECYGEYLSFGQCFDKNLRLFRN